jgi:hypothetical protein
MKVENLADVFRTVGQPSITYVKRDNGRLERELDDALSERGKLCLLTGPSKTGKTTLYREVLSRRQEVPLVIQCDQRTKVDDIWRRALESVDFARVQTRSSTSVGKVSVEAETSGKVGWNWLAEMTAKFKGTFGVEQSEQYVKARILAEPGPDLLIPILQRTSYKLVIEDFHYLDDSEKVLLFQQWKRLIDHEISVLVLGTTHRAVDIASSNKDLVGRIAQIDIGHWSLQDLEAIYNQGFEYLKIQIVPIHRNKIATEAVGLPIIVQQTCLRLFSENNVKTIAEVAKARIQIDEALVYNCLHKVARISYTQFESYYNTLIRGPREKTRKYRTYELILACFSLDPIRFSLKRSDISERLTQLSIADNERPPFASLNSTLGALRKFQNKRNFNLLEWRPAEEILYIIEPAFLFYVRG